MYLPYNIYIYVYTFQFPSLRQGMELTDDNLLCLFCWHFLSFFIHSFFFCLIQPNCFVTFKSRICFVSHLTNPRSQNPHFSSCCSTWNQANINFSRHLTTFFYLVLCGVRVEKLPLLFIKAIGWMAGRRWLLLA